MAAMMSTATTTQTSNVLSESIRVLARDGKSKGSVAGAVLMDACSKIESPMLPRVLLKTHVTFSRLYYSFIWLQSNVKYVPTELVLKATIR